MQTPQSNPYPAAWWPFSLAVLAIGGLVVAPFGYALWSDPAGTTGVLAGLGLLSLPGLLYAAVGPWLSRRVKEVGGVALLIAIPVLAISWDWRMAAVALGAAATAGTFFATRRSHA